LLSRRALLRGAAALGASTALAWRAPVVARANPAGTLVDLPRHLRDIEFPEVEAVTYFDDFGDCRGGEGCPRRHEGIDMVGEKWQRLLSAVDGRVHDVQVATKGDPTGNWLTLVDDDGWTYHYGHINNDTPMTDDGRNPQQYAFGPGIVPGATVRRGQFVAYMGDSGNAEGRHAHLHFEIHDPDDRPVNPYVSLRIAEARRLARERIAEHRMH